LPSDRHAADDHVRATGAVFAGGHVPSDGVLRARGVLCAGRLLSGAGGGIDACDEPRSGQSADDLSRRRSTHAAQDVQGYGRVVTIRASAVAGSNGLATAAQGDIGLPWGNNQDGDDQNANRQAGSRQASDFHECGRQARHVLPREHCPGDLGSA
jgi:hypothetical protein